jgi:hypothetical protein
VNQPRTIAVLAGACLCVLGALVPSRTGHAWTAPSESHLSISLLEHSDTLDSLSAPPVLEVSALVGAALSSADGRLPQETVLREALSKAYGASFEESPETLGYTLVWDPELMRWIWICTGDQAFTVAFGPEETVQVLLTTVVSLK